MGNDFGNVNVVPSADENLSTGLPPNINGNKVENAIDAATLGNFTPDGQQGVPQSDIDFVNNQIDPLTGELTAIPGATNDLFFPGLDQPLRAGSTSGQLTGSRDIFVARGGLKPFAAIERRKQAEQAAALKRKKDLSRFKVKQPKLSKDPRFNENILRASSFHDEEFISRAQREFGDKWQVALTSPETKIGREYIQGKANLDLLAGKTDQIVDLMGEVESSIKEGDQFVSDATLRLHNSFSTLSDEFSQEGGDLGAADLGGMLDKLQVSQTLDQFVKENDILKNIDGEILQRAGIDDSNADQFRQTTRYTEDFAKGVATQAKRVKGNVAFRSRPDLSEEDISKILGNLKGKVDKRTASVKAKPKSKGVVDPKSIAVSNQEQVINVKDQNFNVNKSIDLSNDIKTKPIKFNGLIQVNSDGTLQNLEGIQNILPGAFKVMKDANGVDRKVMTAQVVHEKRDSRGKAIKTFEDVVLDYDNLSSGLANSSKNAKTFVDVFNNETIDVKEREKEFGDLTKDFKGDFDPNIEDIGRRFTTSGFKFDEFDKFLSSESRAGRDIVLTEDAKTQFKTELTEKTFNEAKARLNKPGGKSYSIDGDSFTEEELRGAGWTDADIKTLN